MLANVPYTMMHFLHLKFQDQEYINRECATVIVVVETSRSGFDVTTILVHGYRCEYH